MSKILLPILWLFLFGLLMGWRIQNLNAYGVFNDEGVYLMWARLVADGYPLYAETTSVQWPLFIEVVALGMRWLGPTIEAGRWVMLPGFGLVAFSLGWLGYRTGGWPAAFTALILSGISPLIFTFSRLVMGEIPALGLALAAIIPLVKYLDQAHKGWLIVSGLLFGLSLICKPIVPFMLVPVGYLLLVAQQREQAFTLRGLRWPAFVADCLIWGVAGALPVGLVFVFYAPAAAFDQLVAFRGDLRAVFPPDWPATWSLFQIFITTHWGYLLLAMGGTISTIKLIKRQPFNNSPSARRLNSTSSFIPRISLIFSWLWLISGTLLLLWHTPLFLHHLVVVLPPLILLSAQLVSNVIFMWRYRAGALSTGHLLFYTLFLAVALLNLPAIISANQQQIEIVTGGREREAAQFLQAISAPADFVMGDSQLLIFMANRRTPPPLGDVALVGIKAGRQTSQHMIDLSKRYHAPAVVQWSLRLPWLPDYVDWVQQNYLAHRIWDNDHIIHYVQRLPQDSSIPNEQHLHLGDAVQLRGYQLDRASLSAGQTLGIKLYWQTDRLLTQDYTVFSQLLDSSGTLVAGQDSQPLAGYFPTSQWPPDEIITDVVQLPLPADLPPGAYTLVTGMYLLETLERLPVMETGNNFVPLVTIDVD